MRIHELKPTPGRTKSRKRVGRGPGSGHGKTSSRGQKGAKARSGGGKGVGFEGGQTPIQRRLPKLPGFKNPFKKRYSCVNLKVLDNFKQRTVVSPQKLLKAGLVGRNLPVKILGEGKLEKPLTVKAHAFSKKAVEKIEKAGGKTEVL